MYVCVFVCVGDKRRDDINWVKNTRQAEAKGPPFTLYIHMVSGFQSVTRNHCRMSNLVLWMSSGRSMYFWTTQRLSLRTEHDTSSRIGSRLSRHMIPAGGGGGQVGTMRSMARKMG